MAKRSAAKFRGVCVLLACAFLLLGCFHKDDDDGGDAAVDTTDEAAAVSEVVDDGDVEDDPDQDPEEAATVTEDAEGSGADAATPEVLGEALAQIVVRPNDTMTGIVQSECGSPLDLDLVHQVFLDNAGVPQEASSDALGDRLLSPNLIEIGWVLLIDCTLRDDSPARTPLACLDGDERSFGGQTAWTDAGTYFSVTICVSDDGRAEYFGINQNDESIRLPACRDDDGAFRAENQGWTYELAVDSDGDDATLVLTDDSGIERLNLGFVTVALRRSVEVPLCTPPPAVYVVRPAALSRIAMRNNPPAGFPPDTPDSGCIGYTSAAIVSPGPATILEPGAPVFVEQGRWLRFSLRQGVTDASLVGGGLSWTVAPAFVANGVQEFNLMITDRHPPGTYQVEVDGELSALPPVIIEPSRELTGGYVSKTEGATTFLYYGLSPDDEVSIFHEVMVGCDDEWHRWGGDTIEANDDGNGRLVIETGGGHVGSYCLVLNDANVDINCRAFGLFSVS